MSTHRFVLSFGVLLSGCAAEDYAALYETSPVAPSFNQNDVMALEYLGPLLVDQGASFTVYSQRATRIDLALFDDPESDLPTQQFSMARFGDVWSIYVEGVGLGQHYGYIAWGANWPEDPRWYPGSVHGFVADVDAAGNRFNPNKLLLDPYAKMYHRDHDWGRGSLGTGAHRTSLTYGAASKNVIVESTYLWSNHEAAYRLNRQNPNWVGHRWQDLILYEVHPKGFTASPASGVEHPGTYRGMGEKADYLADLGITGVELMPVHEKPGGNDGGYWGYQTLNFFQPEVTYAWDNEREEAIDEFKWMVDELHQRGIEVILDVVYNHTGEGGLWRDKRETGGGGSVPLDSEEVASLYSYRGLDNNAYYALSVDNRGYWNNTGVGNQTRPNFTPMRRLIMDSLRYWVEEMHVDGFRFDLAPVLGEIDGDYNNWDNPANTVLQDIIDDPVLQRYNTRIISEPWSINQFRIGDFPRSSTNPTIAWYDWNAHFRDFWRSFVNEDSHLMNQPEGPVDLGASLTGSSSIFEWKGGPHLSLNFITIHDGFTMYDLVSFNNKENLCGPLNPVCCVNPYDPFCDPNSGEDHNRSRDWGMNHEEIKRQQMRNLFTALLIARGTPMILGGDEWMRTQFGNNNAYTTGADNYWNWFQWGVWEPSNFRNRMFDFVRGLNRFRKEHSEALAPASYTDAPPMSWKDAGNNELGGGDWGRKHVMMHYYSASPELLILINMEPYNPDDPGPAPEISFSLPSGRSWVRVIDTQAYFDSDEYLLTQPDPKRSANIGPVPVTGSTYGVKNLTIVVLEAGN